ncbi:Ion transport protein-domain-containing protein [Paraphysoderma sedebokerense]|nr:Ion transport protein-domain-containing protein [Paraphysoderma sedebokerense]
MWFRDDQINHSLPILPIRPIESPTRNETTRFVRLIVTSRTFNSFILFVIFVNCVIIAIEASLPSEDQTWGLYLDGIFLSIYTIEFVLKIYVEPKRYWRSSYNRFDFFVLSITWIQWLLTLFSLELGNVAFLKVFKSLRALRSFRSIASIRRLQVIVNALLRTLRKNVLDIIACLVCIMFLFAVMGYYLFGVDELKGDKENWGTLGNAFMSLLLYVTASNWTDPQQSLTQRGFVGSEWFSVVFMFIGNFIFTNLFIGVICQNIDEATEADRAGQLRVKIEAQRVKKEMLRVKQKNDMNQLLAKGDLNNLNMQNLLQSLAGTLRHDEIVPMSHLSCNLTWFETFMVTLHYHENTMYRCQQTHFNIANTVSEILDRRLKSKAARNS